MKKFAKYLLIISLTLFIIINAIVAIQSYSFTHFVNNTKYPPTAATELSLSKKLGILFTGIDLPRPMSDVTPKGNYKEISIEVDADKTLSGWHLPTDSLKKGIVLVFHGYIDTKASMLDVSEEMLKLGYDVLLIDFMGSGKSYGNQSTMGYLEAENVLSTYNYATTNMNEKNIFLYGFSMGAAAIMKAQHDSQLNVSGIMLQAPYATMKGTIGARVELLGMPQYPLTSLFTFWLGKVNGFDAFSANPIDDAAEINVPTLLMCGLKDPNIPEEETKAIFNAIASPSKELRLFENSKHESYLIAHPNEWKIAVKNFIENSDKNNL